MTEPATHDMVLTRVFDAPVNAVWRAPDDLGGRPDRRWLGGRVVR